MSIDSNTYKVKTFDLSGKNCSIPLSGTLDNMYPDRFDEVYDLMYLHLVYQTDESKMNLLNKIVDLRSE